MLKKCGSHFNVPTKTLRLLLSLREVALLAPANGDCHGNCSYSRLGKQTDIAQIYSTEQLGRKAVRPAIYTKTANLGPPVHHMGSYELPMVVYYSTCA